MLETIHLRAEIRATASKRKIEGLVIPYGEISPSHRERFAPGSLRVAPRGVVNVGHDRAQAISGWPGAATFREVAGGLLGEITVDDSPEGRQAIADVLAGKLAGWSVEFNHAQSETVNGIREVREAVLVGLGLVRAPSYPDTSVNLRERQRRSWIC